MELKSGEFILGVDPGLSGAVALYDPFTSRCKGVWNTPTEPSKTNHKRDIDLQSFSSLIGIHAPSIAFAMVENVGAMPGQGVVSMFRFGQSLGAVTGILASFMIPTYYVVPSVWKSALGLFRDKKESIKKAHEFFPESKSAIKNDGMAEALLIAVFAGNMALGNPAGMPPVKSL